MEEAILVEEVVNHTTEYLLFSFFGGGLELTQHRDHVWDANVRVVYFLEVRICE